MDKLDKASDDILAFILPKYVTEEGDMSAETLVCAFAALTGDQLVRHCVPLARIEPGSKWIYNEDIDSLMYKREEDSLYIILSAGALTSGLAFAELPDMDPIIADTDDVIREGGEQDYPPLSVADYSYPHEWSPNVAVRYRYDIDGILLKHKIKGEEKVIACALATSKMIKAAAEETGDPYLFLLLALEMLAGVSRMVPLKQEIPALW
ncbi:MAG: hypothetical protein H6858_04325 [Rhodospirillales bacterium]|nr:hypothetical protein [Alphaproteobacteria bacterium]MCB1839993.1 hypothetical protein [Alphaproteobacteria bacterium]MCB9976811.1 hypothetical protein [Rhodospirillales bacterium]